MTSSAQKLLPELTLEQDMSRVIHHELGHWLMAREVGFEVGGIEVGKTFKQEGGTSKVYPRAESQLDSLEAVVEFMTRRVKVLCAGVCVEFEWYRKMYEKRDIPRNVTNQEIFDNGVINTSGLTDKDKIFEMLIILAGIENEAATSNEILSAQMYEIFEKIYSQAEKIVNNFIEKLFSLAEMIEKEGLGYLDKHNKKLRISKECIVQLEVRLAK